MKTSKFTANIDGDYARPNLFEVTIPGADGAKLVCKAASLPATTVGVVEVPYMNRKIKVPGDRTFADWTVTVINDNAMEVRKALLSWQADIQGFDEWDGGLGDHPTSDTTHKIMEVDMFDRGGAQIGTVQIEGWPSEIGSIDLSWESNDAVQEFTVTFSVTWSGQA